MNDLIASIRLYFHEKISSPFFGAFLVSWLIWNHQYLFFIFDGTIPVEHRFNLAHQVLYPTWEYAWGRALVGPLVTGLSYVLIYPFPELWLFTYWHRRQNKLREKRNALDGAQMLSVAESRKLTLAMLEIETKYEDKMSLQAKQLESLQAELLARKAPSSAATLDEEEIRLRTAAEFEDQKQELAQRDQEIARLMQLVERNSQKVTASLDVDKDPSTKQILQDIATNGGIVYQADSAGRLGMPFVKYRHVIDELESQQLIALDRDSRGNDRAQLTKEGRALAVSRGLI